MFSLKTTAELTSSLILYPCAIAVSFNVTEPCVILNCGSKDSLFYQILLTVHLNRDPLKLQEGNTLLDCLVFFWPRSKKCTSASGVYWKGALKMGNGNCSFSHSLTSSPPLYNAE